MNVTTIVEYLAYFHLGVFILGTLFLMYTFAKGITPGHLALGQRIGET